MYAYLSVLAWAAVSRFRVDMPEEISAPNLLPLNPSQIEAVKHALEHRLTLIQVRESTLMDAYLCIRRQIATCLCAGIGVRICLLV